MFSTELRSGAARGVLLEWGLPALELWAVFPTGRAATAEARAFVELFERVSTHNVRPPGVSAPAAAVETNEHLFDAGRHSTLWADEYGDT